MEVKLCVPHGTDISAIEKAFGGIYLDEETEEFGDSYFIGRSNEEYSTDKEYTPEDRRWMLYEEAVYFCGFCDGYLNDIDGMDNYGCMIEDNGQWAQGQISETAIYKKAFKRGLKAKLRGRN